VVVAQWKLRAWKKDMVCLAGGDWRPLKEVLYSTGGFWSEDKCFIGNDGKEYRWRRNWKTLFVTRSSNKQPLLEYHRHAGIMHQSYLEVLDSSALTSLDSILMTFLIMEKKKRDSEKASAAAG